MTGGIGSCAVCAGALVHSITGGFGFDHCRKPHLHGVTRSRADRPRKIAHDGHRHGSIKDEWLDLVVTEVTLAACGRKLDAYEVPLHDTTAERERLEQALQAQGRISRSQYDEWTAEIDAERAAAREALRELRKRNVKEQLPDGVTLRELWPQLSNERRREWIQLVFKGIKLYAAPNLGKIDLAQRIELEFQDGYQPPVDELEGLLHDLERRARRASPDNRTPRKLEEEILRLHEQGQAPSEIAERGIPLTPVP